MGCGAGKSDTKYSNAIGEAEHEDLENVAKDPSAFVLVLSGHERSECNGDYYYDGTENGKPRFSKTPGGAPKIFWTNWGRGHSWDIFWGGFSPEAPLDTPVPPPRGYTRDQGKSNIRVEYVKITKDSKDFNAIENPAEAEREAEHEDLENIAKDPSAFVLVLSGHERSECNGRYSFDGTENGKPRFSKTPGGAPKVFWTNWGRGHSWDIFWGGFSPEAPLDTPVPPRSGYTRDQGQSNICVEYERITK